MKNRALSADIHTILQTCRTFSFRARGLPESSCSHDPSEGCFPFALRLWYSDVPGVDSVVNHWSFVQLAGAFDSFADHVEAVKDKRRRVERSLSAWKHPGLRWCMQRWLEYMNIVAEERMEEAQEMTRKLMHEAQGVPPLHTLPAHTSDIQHMRNKTMTRTRVIVLLTCARTTRTRNSSPWK